jgi:chromosome segregation protein
MVMAIVGPRCFRWHCRRNIDRFSGRGVVPAVSQRGMMLHCLDEGLTLRVVTLDGQVVNAGGSMTGGSSVKNAGLLSRRAEIERLQAEAEELAGKADAAREAWKQAQQEAAAAEAQLIGTKGERANTQEDRIRFEGELRRLKEQVSANERAVTEFANEIKTLGDRAEEFKRQAAEAAKEA